MAMRKIHSESNGINVAKVYRDSDWYQFIIRLYINGLWYEPADYFTDDKHDALDTAIAMAWDGPLNSCEEECEDDPTDLDVQIRIGIM